MTVESTWADETPTNEELPQGVDFRPHLEALAARRTTTEGV